jgi:ribosomal-protein-alanine N-acetyltransferase
LVSRAANDGGTVPYSATNATIETERLILRKPAPEDAATIGALFGDADIMRFYGTGRTYTPSEIPEIMSKIERHYEQFGYGVHVVTLKITGDPIGVGGLQHVGGWACVQIGGAFAKNSWKKGYAIEAGSALLRYGLTTLGIERIEANTPATNAPAIAVARKLRMTYEGMTLHEGTEYARFAAHAEILKGPSPP